MRSADNIFRIRAILGKLRACNPNNINEDSMYEYNIKLLGLDETYYIICMSDEVKFNERF